MSDESVRVLPIPARHAYPARLRRCAPDTATLHLDDPKGPGAEGADGPWWPPPALSTRWLERHHGEFDVVHLHFGFDSRTPAQLTRWCTALRGHGIPLVLTVHDIVNPHFVDQGQHLERLEVLVAHAAALVTLTPGAAAEIRRRWGRLATVLPHPHVAPLQLVGVPPHRPVDRFRVGVHLKSLRANVVAAPVVKALAAATAGLPGAQLSVHLHREVVDPGHPRHDRRLLALLRRMDARGQLALTVHDPHTDSQLWAYLRELDLSVLPYAFGTHSGWLEACTDLGTPVLAPRTGFWTQQQPCATYAWGADGPDADQIAARVMLAHSRRTVQQASRAARRAEQQQLAAWHAQTYRELTSWPDSGGGSR